MPLAAHIVPLIGMFFHSAPNARNKAELEGIHFCQKNEAGKIRQSKSVPKRALQFPALFGGLWEWNSNTHFLIGTFCAIAIRSYMTQLYSLKKGFSFPHSFFSRKIGYPLSTTVFTRGALLDRRFELRIGAVQFIGGRPCLHILEAWMVS